MIQLTERHYQRHINAISETSAWISSHKHSSLIPTYTKHLAALEQTLTLIEVVDSLSPDAEIQNVSLLSEKIKELKSA